ncbi:hypothetical protein [Alteromonas macleodii]|uniref:Uncharacterized protein n=1 Tax=Alteromonas macleodii TaxID=28108 RepID=A0AB36FLF2_ALTMA|nr:hypothetical protein [Alteromonas macleodii]OES24624.1 hypothetical protein BFV93_4713 [Alteromonas macleodii]OES25376.1 hypothetical protein BFV94_4424 [Alteromonas macleodii]OES25385.1 hypothetical protein BFV95_4414 [Alteromonas macleodii]OES38690.1 hypothetical protein BFV96_4801 [Alteromonas macleodii]
MTGTKHVLSMTLSNAMFEPGAIAKGFDMGNTCPALFLNALLAQVELASSVQLSSDASVSIYTLTASNVRFCTIEPANAKNQRSDQWMFHGIRATIILMDQLLAGSNKSESAISALKLQLPANDSLKVA